MVKLVVINLVFTMRVLVIFHIWCYDLQKEKLYLQHSKKILGVFVKFLFAFQYTKQLLTKLEMTYNV